LFPHARVFGANNNKVNQPDHPATLHILIVICTNSYPPTTSHLADNMDPEREESPIPLPAPPLLGHLVLVKRKTGEELQRYPIDSERVTFGR
jgi:hypothetical protein